MIISITSYVYLFDCPPLPLPPSCLQVVCFVLEFLNNYTHDWGFEGNICLYLGKICLWLMASMDRPSPHLNEKPEYAPHEQTVKVWTARVRSRAHFKQPCTWREISNLPLMTTTPYCVGQEEPVPNLTSTYRTVSNGREILLSRSRLYSSAVDLGLGALAAGRPLLQLSTGW